jgi:alpha-soluble NSF attachment protein
MFIKLITQAIELYSISGRNTQASGLAKECAEKLEEDYNYEDALKFYEKAAQLYEMDNSISYANQMNAKWADLSVLVDNMKAVGKIIKTYDKIGKKYLS